MMCSTASVQVNVEAAATRSGPGDAGARWHLLHAIGPVLVAAFANSPRRCGRRTGFKSTRQAVWERLDPARTGIPPQRGGEDLANAWTRWALDAPLMLVRREHDDSVGAAWTELSRLAAARPGRRPRSAAPHHR